MGKKKKVCNWPNPRDGAVSSIWRAEGRKPPGEEVVSLSAQGPVRSRVLSPKGLPAAVRRFSTVIRDVATTGNSEAMVKPVLDAASLMTAQRLVRDVPVGEQVTNAILKVVRAARPSAEAATYVYEAVAWGPSPRAAQSLMLCAKARALLQGRLSPSVEDVIALLEPVLKHRMALNFAARADGITLQSIIQKLAATLA